MSQNFARWALLFLIVCAFPLASNVAWTDDAVSDGISGRHFRAIEAAMPELARNQLKVEDYWIKVVDWNESILVLFGARNRPPGTRGSFGAENSFSVELSRHDLHVKRSQFDR
jgi:hypothetical protein